MTINTFNAIWIRDDIDIKPEFIHKNMEAFDAYVEEIDFDKKSLTNIAPFGYYKV